MAASARPAPAGRARWAVVRCSPEYVAARRPPPETHHFRAARASRRNARSTRRCQAARAAEPPCRPDRVAARTATDRRARPGHAKRRDALRRDAIRRGKSMGQARDADPIADVLTKISDEAAGETG